MRRSFVVSFGAALALALSLVVVPVAAQVVTPYVARSWVSTAPTGTDAFVVKVNGARVRLGTPAGAYLWWDGTYVTTPGPFKANAVAVTGAVAIVNAAVLPTCASGFEGYLYRQASTGGIGTTVQTRFCACVSDGAASPTYSWRNLISGTAGTATVCNP